MNKEQLIQSFKEMTQPLEPQEVVNKTIPFASWGLLIVAILILIWVIKQLYEGRKHKGAKLDWLPLIFILALISSLVYGAFLVTVVKNQDIVLTKEEQYSIKAEWKRTVLDDYIKSLDRDKFPVIDYEITSTDYVTAILDVNKPIAVIKDIMDIQYVDTKEKYVRASWVDDLEDVGGSTGYYNTTLYLPKEEKGAQQ